MLKNKILVFGMIFLAGIFMIAVSLEFVSSVGEVSYCCEKTKSGAWCQSTTSDKCDDNYKKAPSSCESTSYCRMGTCIDSEEGTCMENTPQKVCGDKKGVWFEGSPDKVSQCSLGCCLIGDQAAFVTQTRCKRLSSLYGLETNFQTNAGSEVMCIASATSEAKGACVFESELEKTCEFTTKKECQEKEGKTTTSTVVASKGVVGFFKSFFKAEETISSTIEGVSFYEGVLCSDESLGTNCGPSEKTACVEGRDEVYFVDTCGNIANIYDASKQKDKNYWSKIISKSESCGDLKGSAGSATCGNCDYFLGSTCKSYNRADDKVKPNYGNYACRDLNCKFEGNSYRHGETWCANSEGVDESLPGSRNFRMVCYNGEVSVEPCADYRQETCIQSDINGFKTAACRVNMWQDCYSQSVKGDCENTDKRDCQWIENKCVPKNAPGFNFWGEGDAESVCGTATTQCVVTYEKKLTSGKECVDNCECMEKSWENAMNNLCISMGDCGSKKNYIGVEGYHKSAITITKLKSDEGDGGGGLF